MNLIIDALHRKISIYRPQAFKTPSFAYSLDFDFNIFVKDGLVSALKEFLSVKEVSDALKSGPVDLIIPDSGIGYGSMELPPLSKVRTKDVFNTRFKLFYPSFEDFYVRSFEYERSKEKVLYFYRFAKRDDLQSILSCIKANGGSVKSIAAYASLFAKQDKEGVLYPKAFLVIGIDDSELIITRGSEVLCVYSLGYGSNTLLNGESFLDSGYSYENDKACKFASFIEENFSKQEELDDTQILLSDASKGLSFHRPKELRIMRDEVLKAYIVRNNIKKMHALIEDVADSYASSPWFLPISEIKVFALKQIIDGLNDSSEDKGKLSFLEGEEGEIEKSFEEEIANDKLFDSKMKGERRKIDWKKLLTMEIGKKKA